MINLVFMEKNDIERLCHKSKSIWGSKWMWRKKAARLGFSDWQKFEEQMDIKIKRNEEYIKYIEEKYGFKKQNTAKESGANGQGKVPANGKLDSSSPKDAAQCEEIRPGEAEDGATTTGGTE